MGGYMDSQEAQLRKRLQSSGVSVTRVGNEIILNMPGNVTFQTDRAELRPEFYEVLSSVSLVLVEYEKTIVEVTGHTDGTGADDSNMTLSQNRAVSVASYLAGQGIIRQRIITQGFGETMPIADNSTAQGRQPDRRVELRLVPLVAS